METHIKALLKAMLARTPYRIVRDKGLNRFGAIDTCLRTLQGQGYNPKLIIDGGANVGLFSLATMKIFPLARYHLIEPQETCRERLKQLCARQGWTFHPYALADFDGAINMIPTDEPSTGAHIELRPDQPSVSVSAAKLDTLMQNNVSAGDRALLKLDLQGFELYALRGAVETLRQIEVVLTEVSFFAQAYEPSIAKLVSFLAENGFQLHDIAAVTARERDNRAHQGDFVFVRTDSALAADTGWG